MFILASTKTSLDMFRIIIISNNYKFIGKLLGWFNTITQWCKNLINFCLILLICLLWVLVGYTSSQYHILTRIISNLRISLSCEVIGANKNGPSIFFLPHQFRVCHFHSAWSEEQNDYHWITIINIYSLALSWNP